MNSTVKKPLRIALFSVVILSGCALTTGHVDLAYLSDTAKKSPLVTLNAMEVALQIEDQREASDREWVGNKRNGFGMVTAKVRSNKEVTIIVRDALKNELENNGHRVADTQQAPSDVIIRVHLKKYWSDVRIHFWSVEVIGTINANVTIRNLRDDSALSSKPINSSFRKGFQIVTNNSYESVLNGALAEFIRSFSRDPDILKALQLVQREKDRG